MAWINGRVVSDSEAMISIDDRSFRYGDGLFETVIIANKRLYQLDFHFHRLAMGLSSLKIKVDTDKLMLQAMNYVKHSGIIEGFLRINITRGIGSQGYRPLKGIRPNVIMQLMAPTKYSFKPLKLIVSKHLRPSIACYPVNFKTNQALPSILAAIEAEEQNADEAIMLNEHGFVCECSASNIFTVKGDIISTPSLESGALMGSIRNRILNHKSVKATVVERLISLEDLLNADEVFITSVGRILNPIASISDVKEFAVFEKSKELYEILAAEIGIANLIAG